MPRPKLNRERINITLPEDLIKRLDAYAASAGNTRSDVIEDAIQAHLDKRDRQDEKKKR